MKMQPLAELVGQAPPLTPSEMQYRSVPALVWVARNDKNPQKACQACIFKGQRAKVCVQAGELARLAGHQDCEARDVDTDKTHIYALVEQNPRQLSIV